MKKTLILASLVAIALLVLGFPAQGAWQEGLKGEAGLIGPVDREPYEVHNYNKITGDENPFEGYLAEAGILGPSEHRSEMGETMVVDCEQDVFQNYMGEAGITAPPERETC